MSEQGRISREAADFSNHGDLLSDLNKDFRRSKHEQIMRFLYDQEELNKRFDEYALNTDESDCNSENSETESLFTQTLDLHRARPQCLKLQVDCNEGGDEGSQPFLVDLETPLGLKGPEIRSSNGPKERKILKKKSIRPKTAMIRRENVSSSVNSRQRMVAHPLACSYDIHRVSHLTPSFEDKHLAWSNNESSEAILMGKEDPEKIQEGRRGPCGNVKHPNTGMPKHFELGKAENPEYVTENYELNQAVHSRENKKAAVKCGTFLPSNIRVLYRQQNSDQGSTQGEKEVEHSDTTGLYPVPPENSSLTCHVKPLLSLDISPIRTASKKTRDLGEKNMDNQGIKHSNFAMQRVRNTRRSMPCLTGATSGGQKVALLKLPPLRMDLAMNRHVSRTFAAPSVGLVASKSENVLSESTVKS